MHSDLLTVEQQVGLSPRWLVANRQQTDAIFRRALGVPTLTPDQEVSVDQAVISVHRAKQNAIKQFVAHGLRRLEGDDIDDKSTRQVSSTLVDRISGMMGIGQRQAQRYLRAIGLIQDGVIDLEEPSGGPTPRILEGNSEVAQRTLVHEIRLDHLLLLCAGYGSDFHEFVPRPFQFVSNTASFVLRMKISGLPLQMKQREAEFEQKRLFPLQKWTGFPQQPSILEEQTPESKMSLFGFYVWKTGMQMEDSDSTTGGVNSESNRNVLCKRTLTEIIPLAIREAPWVFPEFIGLNSLDSIPDRAKYENAISEAIGSVAQSLGSALLGKQPYTRLLYSGATTSRP